MSKALRSHDALESVRSYTHRMNRDELAPYCASRLKYPVSIHFYLPSKPLHFVLFCISANWIHSKREICGSVKYRVWSNTPATPVFSFYLTRGCRAFFLCWEVCWEQLFCYSVVFSLPLSRLVFYSQSLSGKGSLVCIVGDSVELHIQTIFP